VTTAKRPIDSPTKTTGPGRRQPRTWVIDLRHYLEEDGDELSTVSGPALNLALFVTSIVVWVTDHLPTGDPHTNVTCIRRPGRKRCTGDIFAELDAVSGSIYWQCPWCGENGIISGWQGTLWDRSPAPPEASSTDVH
jgi:hypothetical protein